MVIFTVNKLKKLLQGNDNVYYIVLNNKLQDIKKYSKYRLHNIQLGKTRK